MNIEIVRESENGLCQQYWRFYFYGADAKCNCYAELQRETTRHKLKVVKRWDRKDLRGYLSQIKRDNVPMPQDVIDEAKRAFFDKLTVTL